MMQSMFGDERLKGRNLGDLMAQWLGIVTRERMGASFAGLGLVIDDFMDLFGRDHRTLVASMTGLPSAFTPRGFSRGGPLDAGRVGRRGSRRIGGVQVKPCFEVGDTTLEGGILFDERNDQHLQFRRGGVPEQFRDRRRLAHGRGS